MAMVRAGRRRERRPVLAAVLDPATQSVIYRDELQRRASGGLPLEYAYTGRHGRLGPAAGAHRRVVLAAATSAR